MKNNKYNHILIVILIPYNYNLKYITKIYLILWLFIKKQNIFTLWNFLKDLNIL